VKYIEPEVIFDALSNLFPQYSTGDLEDYAKIASFLTAEERVVKALITVDRMLAEKAMKFPKSKESDGWKRRQEHLEALTREGLQTRATYNIFPMGERGEKDLVETVPTMREVAFRKALREVELEKCGFIDKGRVFIGFVSPQFFRSVVSAKETWKDSIAADHGEYTHRIQWLTIAVGLELSFEKVGHLYSHAVDPEPVKMGRNRGDPADTYLWDVLVDSFQNNGKYKDHPNAAELFQEAVVTDSFRSPNILNVFLLRDSAGRTPFLTAYLHSSLAKVQITWRHKKASGEKFPEVQKFGVYSRKRFKAKWGGELSKDVVAYYPGENPHEVVVQLRDDSTQTLTFADSQT
jgi:hypothetical protein